MIEYKKTLSDFISKSKNKPVVDVVKLISFKDGFFYSDDEYTNVIVSKNNFLTLKNRFKLKKITFDMVKDTIKVGNTSFLESAKRNKTVDELELNKAIIESIKKNIKSPGDLSEYWWKNPDLFFDNSDSFTIAKRVFKKILGNTSKYNFYSKEDNSDILKKLNDVSKYVKDNRVNLIAVLKTDENKISNRLNTLSNIKKLTGPYIEVLLSEYLNNKKLELFNVVNLSKNSKITSSKMLTEFGVLKNQSFILEKNKHLVVYTDGKNKIKIDVSPNGFSQPTYAVFLNSKKYTLNKAVLSRAGFIATVTEDWIGRTKTEFFTKINSSKISQIGKWLKEIKTKVSLKEFSGMLVPAKTNVKLAESLFVFLQRLEMMSFLASSEINFVMTNLLYNQDKLEQLRTTTIA